MAQTIQFPEITGLAQYPGIESQEKFPSVFLSSPFGKNWDIMEFALDKGEPTPDEPPPPPAPPPPPKNQWLYYVVKDKDAISLISQYEEDNSVPFINGGSYQDGLRDITIYYEDPDSNDLLGLICYAKINSAFASCLKGRSNGKRWKELLIENIIDTYKMEGVYLDKIRIMQAIDFALTDSDGSIGLLQRFGSWLFSELAGLIRKMKLTENKWNPNSKNYAPLISLDFADDIVKGWKKFKKNGDDLFNDAKNAINWCEKNIPAAGSFIKSCAEVIIAIAQAVLDAVDQIFELIDLINEGMQLVNSFICGAINEAIEMIASLFDLVSLFIRAIDNVERDKIKKTLETVINDYRKNPGKILKTIKDGIDTLINRYKNNNDYQKAYNLGEDVIDLLSWIEAAAGMIKLLKNLPKTYNNLKAWANTISKKRNPLSRFFEIKQLLKVPGFKKMLADLKSGKIKQAFPKLLSLEEEAVLKFYTTQEGYKNLNKALRGEISMTDAFRQQEQLMNEAIEKLPISKHNTPDDLLYRIENLTEEQINNYYKVNEIIENKHFTSATYSEEAIGKALDRRLYTILIRIEGKSGRLIEDLSTFPIEKEIIFKSRTKFLVKSIATSSDPRDIAGSIKTIILVEQ